MLLGHATKCDSLLVAIGDKDSAAMDYWCLKTIIVRGVV